MTHLSPDDDRVVQRRLAAALDPLLPDAEVEDRIVRRWRTAVADGRDRSHRRPAGSMASRLVPLGAGVAMAGLLGVSLWTHRTSPTAPPARPALAHAPAVVPAPSGLPLPVAEGDQRFVWLRYYPVPPYGKRPTVHVVDWTGALRFSFQFPQNDAAGNGVTVTVSPDGRVGLLSNGSVIDYTGATVGHVAPPTVPSSSAQRWAEDDQHLCSATLAPASVVLTMLDTHGEPRPVAVLPDAKWNDGMPASSQWSREIAVLACSQANDRAVIARMTNAPPVGGDGPWSVWTVQLSTGRVISRLDLTGTQPVVSADGSRLIYQPVTGYKRRDLQPPSGGIPPPVVHDPVFDDLTVVDLNTGRSISKLPPTDQQVLGLSADGRMAVISHESSRTSPQDGIRLVDLTSGRTVRSRQGVEPGAIAIDPLSGQLMVETFSTDGNIFSLGLLLIDGSGRWREVSPGFAPGEVQHFPNIGS